MGPRSWLYLSPQLTLQLSCSLVISSLFTLWSPLHFSNACLVPVFVAVIVGSLSMDQHIGTRLQVSAWVLGPTWVAASLAGVLMTFSRLAGVGNPQHSMAAGYVAATVVLGLLGLALLVFLQAVSPPGPVKIMGVIAILMYGIMVILSTLYPDLSSMWVQAMLSVVLGAVVAAGVGILVGFLVLPSLASDEVWRLMSEALQGAGSVLSYHTSLLMVDEPALLGAAGSDSTAQKSAPAAGKVSTSRRLPAAGAADRRGGTRWQRQQHQHQQQHQTDLQQQHHAHDSSIEIAAASAAVVAACEDARHHAVEATAAAAFSWVDESDAAVSVAMGTVHSNAPAGPSYSSTRSRHSSADSVVSMVGSDAIADAAAEYNKRFVDEHSQQQDGDAAGKPGLKEELLQELAEQQQHQQLVGVEWPSSGSRVDAWVCATAAAATGLLSRRGSTTEPGIRRISEDGSISVSLTSSIALGAGPMQAAAGRQSLDGAASLYFTEEIDDPTFIQMMRVLSQSKSTTSKPPAAADAAAKQSGSSTQQAAATAGFAGVGVGATTGRKGMPHSKSAGSALSALSVAGSSTAPEDWTHAVPQQQGYAGNSSSIVDSQDASPGDVDSPQVIKPLSTFSIASSGSNLMQARANSTLQQRQPSRLSAPSFLVTDARQATGSSSTRQSIGARAWSFLTQGSWIAPQAQPAPLVRSQPTLTAAKQAGLESQQDQKQQRLESSTEQLYDGEVDVGLGSMPPLLPPPTTAAQLQPLIGRAKAVLASARLEPWWLRPKGFKHFDADACMKLLDDIELLLVRLSTLEGVSEERSLMGLHLHQLAHYKGIADALALIFAQLTAFMVHVAMALAARETGHDASAASGKVSGSESKGTAAGAVKSQVPHASSSAPTQAAHNRQSQAAGGTLKPQGPFAQGPRGEVGAGVEGDAASIGISTLLSAMERQGSVVSSYLWQQHKTGWTQAREMLRRELDASLGSYWWKVRKASKQLPVKVPRSREVMILMFLWPICNGVLEACERIEASAQQVLKPSPAAHHHSSSKETPTAHHHSNSSKTGEHRSGVARVQAAVGAWWHSLLRFAHWAGPLLLLVLMQAGWQAGYRAVTTSVPATLSSRQRVQHMLSSRTFQASFKLLLATGFVLVATILLMVYIPAVAQSVPIFGYAAVVLCFQPRVEATVDSATRRVLGTILGACLGLAINSIPDIFEKPFVMLACLAVASVPLGVLAAPQRRTAIVLAVITLAAVSLCGYQASCCTPAGGMSPVDTFVARLASVCGACILVALFNRMVMPWYTSDYALEQLADALEESTHLFRRIYESQLERMRLSELVAGQVKQGGPEALQAQLSAALPTAAASTGLLSGPATQSLAGDSAPLAQCISTAGEAASVPPAVALAACEAAEAQLLVVLRQQVLSRLVAVQLSLAKESVSWRRGVLATPPLVLNVLGAMNSVKEALTSQRLALAPFTRVGAASLSSDQPAGAGGSGSGMLHMMEHCYSMWALPLHPLWLEIMHTVQELTSFTAANLRHLPHSTAARATAKAQLKALLEQLEVKRLDLRHAWLDIRVQLHRAVHANQPRGDSGSPLWPTDSLHLFTQTYGVSRCLNAFAAAAQAVASSLED